VQQAQAEIKQLNKQQYSISGSVDLTTVPDLMQQATVFFKSADKKINIDLSQVTSSNSAALALMLEMLKQARENQIECHFEHLPDTMLTIAKAYGIDGEIREFT
jgi:phospholipid transport system transporter-binding protein